MGNFYHVTIAVNPGITDEQVKQHFDAEPDWFQYSRTCFVVYSDKTARALCDFLDPVYKPSGRIVAFRLDIRDFFGLENPELWKWLEKDRTPPSEPSIPAIERSKSA
jgi:hypothetical protein